MPETQAADSREVLLQDFVEPDNALAFTCAARSACQVQCRVIWRYHFPGLDLLDHVKPHEELPAGRWDSSAEETDRLRLHLW
jgi:hypothetical protein